MRYIYLLKFPVILVLYVAQVLRYNMRFIHNRSANRILCTEQRGLEFHL